MKTLVSDTVVAGSASDWMTVRHLVMRGSQRRMGAELARIAVRDLGTDKRTPWSNAETTVQQLAWLKEHWPAHYERSLGVADALELRPGAPIDWPDPNFLSQLV